MPGPNDGGILVEQFVEAGRVIKESFFGPNPTPDQVLERMEIQQQARVDRWLRETRFGSWVVWPAWMVGRILGLAVEIVMGVWGNIRRGYQRSTTSPYTWDQGDDDAA